MPAMRILMVEDNQDDEILMLREMRKQNVANDITVVHDGAEALDFLFCTGSYADRDPNDIPTVVMLDLKLPKVDGLEVLRRIRDDERTKLLPVVVVTSSDEDEDVAESYSCGANSYVRKPVDFNQFREAMRQLHLYWLLINEPSRKPGSKT